MKTAKKHQLEQLDQKITRYRGLPDTPQKGWLEGVRTAMNMSFRQFGKRLGISAQSAQEIEVRELNESISLKGLREAGLALNLKLVYGFIPMDGSIENTIEMRALEIARHIALRVDNTMRLEDQQISPKQLEKEVQAIAEEIKQEMPRYLWD